MQVENSPLVSNAPFWNTLYCYPFQGMESRPNIKHTLYTLYHVVIAKKNI